MFSSDWLDDVPEPPSNLSDVVGDVASQLQIGLGVLSSLDLEVFYPSFAWSTLLSDDQGQVARLVESTPFVDRVAVGFLDPEIDRGIDPGLGLIVYVDPPEDLLSSGALSDALRSSDYFHSRFGARFPVILRVATPINQVRLTSPSSAMAAGWIEVRKPTFSCEGWLLPLHAVGGLNSGVSYDDGYQGKVVESLGSCFDAAVSSYPPGLPSGLVRRGALQVLAPGLTLEVVNQHGQGWTSTLMDVDVNIGLINYSRAPIRLTYDWSFSAKGDSGALIRLADSGDPVAMHQGVSRIRDSNGRILMNNGAEIRRSFGLCLFQVEAKEMADIYV